MDVPVTTTRFEHGVPTNGRSGPPLFLVAQRSATRRLMPVALGIVLLAVTGIYASGLAVQWGHNIPQEELQLDYLAGVIWALLLGLTIPAWPIARQDRENLLILWVAKSFVTLVLMLPYEFYYELDCFGLFYAARLDSLPLEWWSGRRRGSFVVVALGWLQERFFDSFHAVKVSFAMVGLLAVYLMYRAAMHVIGRSASNFLLYLGLLPSTLFWSSILGKDPLVYFGVGLYVYGVARWRTTNRLYFLMVIAAGVGICTIIRLWLGVILLLPLSVFLIRGARGFMPRLVFVMLSVSGFLVVLQQFAAGLGIEDASEVTVVTNTLAHSFTGGGSAREITTEFTSVPLMLAFIPIGLFTVLFRPLPGEVPNVFGTIAGLENLVLLLLALGALRTLWKNRTVRRRLWQEPIFNWAVLFIVTWGSIYGFVSYQNLGASVRFRLPILTVFVAVIFSARWMTARLAAGAAAETSGPKPPIVINPRPTRSP